MLFHLKAESQLSLFVIDVTAKGCRYTLTKPGRVGVDGVWDGRHIAHGLTFKSKSFERTDLI